MANTIKYIIDYRGWGPYYTLTTTHNSECIDINTEQAKEYLDCSNVFISGKAEVSLKSVPQEEVKDSFTRRLEGALLAGNTIS